MDRENIFPDITELFSREGSPLDADRIFSKEIIIGKVTPSWSGGSTAMELQSNGPPWKMVLIVDSHGNDWNRVDQKFSIEPPIPSSTRSVESLALTTGKLLNRITETVLARCPGHRHSLTRNLPRDPRQRPPSYFLIVPRECRSERPFMTDGTTKIMKIRRKLLIHFWRSIYQRQNDKCFLLFA